MANAPVWKSVLAHPDRDELVSKLLIDVSPKSVNEWLSSKYADAGKRGLVISEKDLKQFKDKYLDLYSVLKEDFSKAKLAVISGTESDMMLAINNNPTYKEMILKSASEEIDLKKSIAALVLAVETRLGQIYDIIQQNPNNINTRIDRVFIEYIDKFGAVIDRANKVINQAPDQIVQHNVSIQHIDQHVSIFYEAIKKALSRFDLSTSMAFMETFNEELSKLKDPTSQKISPVENRMAEVQLLNQTINERLQ